MKRRTGELPQEAPVKVLVANRFDREASKLSCPRDPLELICFRLLYLERPNVLNVFLDVLHLRSEVRLVLPNADVLLREGYGDASPLLVEPGEVEEVEASFFVGGLPCPGVERDGETEDYHESFVTEGTRHGSRAVLEASERAPTVSGEEGNARERFDLSAR